MKIFSIVRKMALMLFTVVCVGSAFSGDASTVSTRSTSALTIDPSMGYIVTGLGELKDQVAVVFTNSAAAATWQAPKNLKNVEFLAVGGGGGGGGHYYSTTAKNCQGGAGGGGGAVVTGFIKDIAADLVVNITVGAGGAGGDATTSNKTGAGKGYNGGNSIIKVNSLTYITAYGGGGDGGYNSKGVANGGSNSGARGAQTAAALKAVTVVGSGAEGLVSDIVSRVNKGGSGGYSGTSGYPGAGGGGAGGVGGSTHSSDVGGSCGYGYISTITGSRVVYGAGGGGGNGKNGGYGTEIYDEDRPFVEGAGLGIVGQAGSDALPNQGGGGGGGSYNCAGGAGGSGVVILRFAYSETDILVDAAVNILPKISDKFYTGEVLSSGLVETYAYSVEELEECVNAGAKIVRVTLNEGYVWSDRTVERYKDFAWNILRQDNNIWVMSPYINVDTWSQSYASNVIFNRADPLVGVLTAIIAKNGGSPQPFEGDLPTEPGTYKLVYKVENDSNHSGLYWEKTFKIYRSEAIDGGYKVYGLGEKGDEIAVVFTNHVETINWTVPANLKNAQFLVVGGGGGGGADTDSGASCGGAGGGGGGVVTGEVDLAKDAAVAITIGAGGAGGTLRTDQKDGESGTFYGASKKGGDSVLSVGGTTYVTAYGGGRDQGTNKRDTTVTMATSNMREGGQGGSNGGSRGGITKAQSKNPRMGAVASIAALRDCKTYGNKGGKGCSEYFYGFPAAGGGGGATEAGGDAGNSSENDAEKWPGGKGGEGLASDITGARVVYGSGGGGASTQGKLGGIGGSGAGNGGDNSVRTNSGQGTSALANQGGGGGGTSRGHTYGGAGGSGIVVIRYRRPPGMRVIVR